MSEATTITEELHLVPSNARPAAKTALGELQRTFADVADWVGRAQQAERDYLCLWTGQSPDYRKWDKFYNRPVAPWDGCSDTRVRLIQESVEELARLQVLAFFNANPAAVQQESHDASASGKVNTLLKYEVRQRMNAELWDEVNFLVAWKEMFGHAVAETRWFNDWGTGVQTITADELVAWLTERQIQQNAQQGMDTPPEMQPVISEAMQAIVLEALTDQDREMAVELITQRFPTLTQARAARVVAELQGRGTATFRLPVRKAGRPQMIARCPGVDIFYPWWTHDIRKAPWVAVVDRLSEVELRKMELTEGWNAEFIDAMITMGPMPAVDPASMPVINGSHTMPRPLFDQAVTRAKKRVEEIRNTFEVVRMFIKAVDEDGVEALHELVMHPSIGTGWKESRKRKKGKVKDLLIAKHAIVDQFYDGGQFVSVRRRYSARPVWESAGVPEESGGYQWQLKKWTDQAIDRNDLAVNPPLNSTHQNAAGKGPRLGIRPGALVRQDRGQEASWMVPPSIDAFGAETEAMIRGNNARLVGLVDATVPEQATMNHQQFIVTGFLVQMREVLVRILALDQQFMDPLLVERVVGNGPLPFKVTREEIAGQFDVNLTFDVKMMDMEYVQARWGVIKEAYANDRSGVMNDAVLTRWLISSIDPALADMAVGDPTQVAQNEANDEKMQLAVAAMGVILPPKEGGNSQSRLAAIQQEMQENVRLQQQYMGDPQFKAIVDARVQKYQFDIEQRNNADIGRRGWVAPEREQQAEQPVIDA